MSGGKDDMNDETCDGNGMKWPAKEQQGRSQVVLGRLQEDLEQSRLEVSLGAGLLPFGQAEQERASLREDRLIFKIICSLTFT